MEDNEIKEYEEFFNANVKPEEEINDSFLNDLEKYFINLLENLAKTNKPALVLKELSENKITALIRFCMVLDGIDCFTITTSHQEKQLVVKKIDINIEDIDYLQSVKEAKEAKANRDYEKVIEINSRILRAGKNNSRNYSNIALSYLKLDRIEEAIDYFNIASYLAKTNNEPANYDAFVAMLSKRNNKSHVFMKENDFKESDYGIAPFEELKKMVLDKKIDINEAMESLGLTDEEKPLAILLIAREYYYKGSISQGDKYLLKAEKTPNKSKLTVKFLDEIRRNKNFYKNRIKSK